MAEEDDYDDFVLEVKCLDTGKTETVKSDTRGLAGISWEERKRIRGSVVLGEKLLMDKIASFKKGVQAQKASIKSRVSRRTTWGGNNKQKEENTKRITEGTKKSSELTFALRSTPYSAADGGMDEGGLKG